MANRGGACNELVLVLVRAASPLAGGAEARPARADDEIAHRARSVRLGHVQSQAGCTRLQPPLRMVAGCRLQVAGCRRRCAWVLTGRGLQLEHGLAAAPQPLTTVWAVPARLSRGVEQPSSSAGPV